MARFLLSGSMTVWHIILSLALVAVAALIAWTLSRGRKRREDERFPNGVTFNKPQQEATQTPAPESAQPESKRGGAERR